MTHHETFWGRQARIATSTAVILLVGGTILSFFAVLHFLGLLFGFTVLGAFGSSASSAGQVVYGDRYSSNAILAIDVRGPIEGVSSGDDFGMLFGAAQAAYGYDIKQQLMEAADRDTYRAVILQIDSPGGTIFGSKAIADGVAYYKQKTQKPVYAHVQGMAASGAYWAAVSADKLIADSGTAIGSIGVIYGPFSYFDKPVAVDGGLLSGGVVTQNGIEQRYFTAGEGKDAGNPFRRLTEREQTIIQQNVNDSYEEFVAYVSKRRNIFENQIRLNIGAHMYGEQSALKNKLIDSIMTRESAYIAVARAAGLSSDDFYVEQSLHESSGFLGWTSNLFNSTSQQSQKPQACTASIAIPLVYYGQPAAHCQ